MRGGYEEQVFSNYTTVAYDETEQINIHNYLANNPGALSTEIRDALFPGMREQLKANAAHQIQVVLGRAVPGN